VCHPQVPAEAEASEFAAAAALLSAVHEMPEVCTVTACCLLLTRFAIWYFADLCRSPPKRAAVPQRAAGPQSCLHMQCDLNASNPRVRGWIQRNRSLLTANNSMNRVRQQVCKLRGDDRMDLEH
jgi:hypothetical protein